MSRQVVLASVNVLQHPVSVDGVRFFLKQFLQIRFRRIQSALLNLLTRFREQWMADPSDFLLNSFLRNLLQPGSPHSQRDQTAKNETANVRPMGNAPPFPKRHSTETFPHHPHSTHPNPSTLRL